VSTLIDLDAELAACVFVTSTAAKARAQLFAAIEPSHFAQQPCADFWRIAKAFEAEGTSTAWLCIVEALQASKASHPNSRSWGDWFHAIRDQSAHFLARGGLTPDERAEELERDLRNAHERREIRRVCLEGAARAEEKREAGDALRVELVERLVPRTVQADDGLVSTRDAARQLLERLSSQTSAATPSPWPSVDRHAPLTPGSLTVLAAATGVGKTVLGIQYARACHASKAWCMFVGLEMGPDQNLARVARQEYGVEHRPELVVPTLRARAYSELTQAIARLVNDGFRCEWACSPVQSTEHVTMRAKLLAARLAEEGERLGLIVVDYLGILSPTSEDTRQRRERHELFGEYALRLKLLARQLKVPVVALAQLNREAEKAGTKATRGMIGDSYAILRHADNVLILTRPIPGTESEGASEPRLSIQKAREGSPAWFTLTWNEQHERYEGP
jgi:replicative DNA helicase